MMMMVMMRSRGTVLLRKQLDETLIKLFQQELQQSRLSAAAVEGGMLLGGAFSAASRICWEFPHGKTPVTPAASCSVSMRTGNNKTNCEEDYINLITGFSSCLLNRNMLKLMTTIN